MDHDFYWLFSRFWWLIFPLFWMGVMVMAHWSRHNRANRALDIVKSYADQGKDNQPPVVADTTAWALGSWGRRRIRLGHGRPRQQKHGADWQG